MEGLFFLISGLVVFGLLLFAPTGRSRPPGDSAAGHLIPGTTGRVLNPGIFLPIDVIGLLFQIGYLRAKLWRCRDGRWPDHVEPPPNDNILPDHPFQPCLAVVTDSSSVASFLPY